jgi:hypothetical protein
MGNGDMQNATMCQIIVVCHFLKQLVSGGKGNEIWFKIFWDLLWI